MQRFRTRLVDGFAGFLGARRHVVLAIAVLVAAFLIRLGDIRSALPYPQHADEAMLADIALRMVQTGDLNPHDFRKPSTAVYLMAGGFSLGLATAELSGNARSAEALGTKSLPYYRLASAVLVPKILFALASVLALGLVGYVGYCWSGQKALLWVVPMIASLSPSYYRFSWSYMNVDILGAFFALLLLAHLVRERVRQTRGLPAGGARAAAIAGVLAGLTIGSKYNLFPILVPCVLWFAFFETRSLLIRVVTLGGAACAAFLVTTPYAVLDVHVFVRDVLREAHHYATGHAGTRAATVDAGLPMIRRHLRLFHENFGIFPLIIAAVGWIAMLWRDVRIGLVLVSYPLVFVAYMCAQHVFFERNVVVVHLLIALGLVVGLGAIAERVTHAVITWRPTWTEGAVRAVSAGLVLALAALGLPWKNVQHAHMGGADPRNQAARWIEKNVDSRATVLVDEAVGMDVRVLEERYRVLRIDPQREKKRIDKLVKSTKRIIVVSRDNHRARYAKALGRGVRTRFVESRTRRDGKTLGTVRILERRGRKLLATAGSP